MFLFTVGFHCGALPRWPVFIQASGAHTYMLYSSPPLVIPTVRLGIASQNIVCDWFTTILNENVFYVHVIEKSSLIKYIQDIVKSNDLATELKVFTNEYLNPSFCLLFKYC